jgi:hypothetical protein
MKESVALLWRTTKDGTFNIYDASGFSGTVLCLGNPSNKTTKAVLFQNFQQSASRPMTGTDLPHQWIKGGFLLPAEILQSTIDCSESDSALNNGNTFLKTRFSTDSSAGVVARFRSFT